VSKKLFCTILFVFASGFALASCAGAREGLSPDNKSDCTKQAFPQCGLDGAH
jgi:hypothetical protein